MGSTLPQVYWYAFWCFAALGLLAYGFFLAVTKHRRNMKALDILKAYAEKGGEPPPVIAEQLTKQFLNANEAASAPETNASAMNRRGELLKAFIGFVFAACVAAGLHSYLLDTDGAKWAVHASAAARAFFGFGAFGLLLVTLLTRKG